jgi:Permeases of the drug/metabolite transporter (DMT) superfamily
MNKIKAEYFMLLNTIIWGGTFVIIKMAFADISPMLFLSIRFVLASLLMLPAVFSLLPKIDKTRYREGMILGFLVFVGFAVQTVGLKFTTATKSGFITGTFVVFTPILQTFIEKKMPNKGNLIGIVLVFIGLLFLSSRGNSLFSILSEIGTTFNVGDFLTLLCAIFYGLYIVYLHKISAKHEHMFLVFFQLAMTAVLSIFFMFVLDAVNIEKIHIGFSWYLVFTFAYTVILATIVTTTIQTKFQQKVSPTKTSIIFSFEPIFAATFAYFVLSEKISNFGFLGCVCILCGLLVSELWATITKGKNA